LVKSVFAPFTSSRSSLRAGRRRRRRALGFDGSGHSCSAGQRDRMAGTRCHFRGAAWTLTGRAERSHGRDAAGGSRQSSTLAELRTTGRSRARGVVASHALNGDADAGQRPSDETSFYRIAFHVPVVDGGRGGSTQASRHTTRGGLHATTSIGNRPSVPSVGRMPLSIEGRPDRARRSPPSTRRWTPA